MIWIYCIVGGKEEVIKVEVLEVVVCFLVYYFIVFVLMSLYIN